MRTTLNFFTHSAYLWLPLKTFLEPEDFTQFFDMRKLFLSFKAGVK